MQGRLRAIIVYSAKALRRRLRWAISDLRGRGDLTPPRSIDFVGGGNFDDTGAEFLALFKSLGGLQPSDRVLDAGCGVGRMATPLLDYLDEDGSYEGFDVGRAMIRWCRRTITPRRPDFRFTWAPVYNRKYNPFGTVTGSEFEFPYPDSSFDFAFATSLFTHLSLADTRRYLEEISRVLRPGGSCLLTFFVLNPHARAEVEAGRASFQFRHPVPGGLTTNQREPEAAIAFDLGRLEAAFADAGLAIRAPIHFGLWANNPDGAAGQDIIVAEKAAGAARREAAATSGSAEL